MGIIREHILWLEEDPLRIRKYLAVLVAYVWCLSLIVSFILNYFEIDTVTILTIVSAQFSAVIGFYFLSNAKSDALDNNDK